MLESEHLSLDTLEFDWIFEDMLDEMIAQYEEELDSELTYHNSNHVMDVLEAAEFIAEEEGITSEIELFILKIAALFHDAGFMEAYADHEVISCRIMREELEVYSLPEFILERIEGLIMATKVPSNPQTHLQQIICDADLDYLGRDDFPFISEQLKTEFLTHGIVDSEEEWEEKQLKFFEYHQYYTKTSRVLRKPIKESTYQKLLADYRNRTSTGPV